MKFSWIIISFYLVFASYTLAKVDPPNFDFNIQTFSDFYPGKDLTSIGTKYGKGDLVEKKGDYITYQYKIKHNRYVFPIFVQFAQTTVVDFFANLPTYFLHDVFHQALINQLGKQKSYLRKEESAVYTWEKDNLKHIYNGTCTITCFPVFYSVIDLAKETSDKKFKSILSKQADYIKTLTK